MASHVSFKAITYIVCYYQPLHSTVISPTQSLCTHCIILKCDILVLFVQVTFNLFIKFYKDVLYITEIVIL
jgi:hypothetical protein